MAITEEEEEDRRAAGDREGVPDREWRRDICSQARKSCLSRDGQHNCGEMINVVARCEYKRMAL